MGPLSRANVHKACARGITSLHGRCAGQVEIDEVMGQQYAVHLRIQICVVLAKPQQFRCRVAWQNRIAQGGDAGIGAAHLRGEIVTLCGRRRIAPQLNRHQWLAAGIDRHETVLLT